MTGSAEETRALGEALGRQLRPGDVVAFHGELGSGKTTLIQGVARGLGLDPDRIKSPTFVLVREHPPAGAGGTAVVHIDGYRLAGAPAAAWLDVDLMLSPTKITLIEWAERFGALLPEERLEVVLSHVSTNRRRIALHPSGARAQALIAGLPAPAAPTEESDAPAGD